VPITYEIYHELMVHLPFPYTKWWLGRLISKAFKAAGIKGSAINLRHSFGTYWSGDELALQQIMGHAKLETTQRYRRIRLEYLTQQYNTHAPILTLLRQPSPMF
jgi:integrase